MRRSEISSYLAEEAQSRVEDRMGLFPAIGEWLNSHISNTEELQEENEISIDSLKHLSPSLTASSFG